MVEDLIEQYFSQKDVVKRHHLLKAITFKCEFASKEFFERAFKKERKLEEKLTALRGYAFYASEQEIEPCVNKLLKSVMKVPQTTPYAYNLYEDMRAAYLLPYLVKTYNYPCFIRLSNQVEKQYEAMPDVFKKYIAMMKMVSIIKYVIRMKCKNHGMLFGNINVHNINSITYNDVCKSSWNWFMSFDVLLRAYAVLFGVL